MIEDFSRTGRQPGIARPTWKASETLRGSKRVHFAGITGFQSRECQERYMWRSVERALCALSDHGARTLSLAGDLGLPADLTRIFAAWLHVETLQYRPGTFTHDVLDKAYGEACRG